jgi:hypothetical protein
MSIEVCTAETVSINTPDTSWGIFCFNSIGDLFLNSDWGMFCYSWRSFGKDFREFLAGLNADYVICKFSQNYDENMPNNKRLGSKINKRRKESVTKLIELFITELRKGTIK